MNFKILVNVSKKFTEPTISLNVPELNDEVSTIEKKLQNLINEKNQLIGTKDYDIYLIETKDIITVYSEDKYNYCKTKDGIFKLKEKLYFLEEILPRNEFIRISNSTIVNIKHIKCFNTSLIGKIIVKLKNGDEFNVSRSRTKDIMNLLKERKNNNE